MSDHRARGRLLRAARRQPRPPRRSSTRSPWRRGRCRGKRVRRVLTYAPTSSTEWTPAPTNWFVPNWFVDVTRRSSRRSPPSRATRRSPVSGRIRATSARCGPTPHSSERASAAPTPSRSYSSAASSRPSLALVDPIDGAGARAARRDGGLRSRSASGSSSSRARLRRRASRRSSRRYVTVLSGSRASSSSCGGTTA